MSGAIWCIFIHLGVINIGLGYAAVLPSSLNREDSENVCATPGCVLAANHIKKNMDESIDPCNNFYHFACGGWINSRTIPEDKSAVSAFDDVQEVLNAQLKELIQKPLTGTEPEFVKMMKTLHDSCMDVETIEKLKENPLKDHLQKVGGWPVVEGDKWDEASFDWIDTLIKFRNLGYGTSMLISFYVSTDLKDNTKHIVEMDQASLELPDRTYYLDGLNDTATSEYFKLAVNVAKKLGADENTAKEELLKVLQFETLLAEYSLPDEERRNYSALYNKYTIKQLKEESPEIDWLRYFNGLLNDEVTENEPVVVAVPSFVRNVSQLISKTDKRTIANYMVGQMVLSTISLLSEDWRNMLQGYRKALTGQTEDKPRWKTCLAYVNYHLNEPLSSYYVRNHFQEESKNAADEMVNYVLKEFLNILENVDWMEAETKAKAIDKAKGITPYIGYPKELMNDQLVSELYANITLKEKAYFENLKMMDKFQADKGFNELRKPNIKGDWKSHAMAAIVNAFYSPVENTIDFPAGILQNIFFSKDRPNYMNFGAIGYVIGHEVTHGFDDTGRQFDKEGNNKNWWDDKTDQRFRQKAQCIIDQYSNYTVKEVGMNVNGITTQGENMADNGGVKEAYRAYLAWVKDHAEEPKLPGLKYNQKQLFWLSVANVWCGKTKPEALRNEILNDAHSPGEFRIIGALSNALEFSEDFQCPLGSPMNPEHKCKVW